MTANTLTVRRREVAAAFWTDEKVVELPSDSHRLMFIGLFAKADREGRLEDRPMVIGMKVRPWDPRGAAALIDGLVSAGLVVRYVVRGARLMWLPKFKKYQRCHPHEAASALPAHDDPEAISANVIECDDIEKTQEDTPKLAGDQDHVSPMVANVRLSRLGSSEPSGPSEPSDTSSAERKKRVRTAKVVDPRHVPMRTALIEAFKRKRGIEYPFDYGREDAEVRRLLKLGIEPTVLAAWDRALDSSYPTISTLAKFRMEFPRFVGRGEAVKGALQPTLGLEGSGPLTATEGAV